MKNFFCSVLPRPRRAYADGFLQKKKEKSLHFITMTAFRISNQWIGFLNNQPIVAGYELQLKFWWVYCNSPNKNISNDTWVIRLYTNSSVWPGYDLNGWQGSYALFCAWPSVKIYLPRFSRLSCFVCCLHFWKNRL